MASVPIADHSSTNDVTDDVDHVEFPRGQRSTKRTTAEVGICERFEPPVVARHMGGTTAVTKLADWQIGEEIFSVEFPSEVRNKDATFSAQD